MSQVVNRSTLLVRVAKRAEEAASILRLALRSQAEASTPLAGAGFCLPLSSSLASRVSPLPLRPPRRLPCQRPSFDHRHRRRFGALSLLAAMNTALVFVKPHAANDAVLELTKKHLGDKGIKIVREGELGAQEIKAKGIIDDHYAALAANAVKTLPKDLLVADANKAKFAQEYGKSWDTAVGDGSFLNLAQYQEKFPDLSAVEVEKRWRAGATVKLAPGNY
eukprot:3734291-Rhodomonas_salina.2